MSTDADAAIGTKVHQLMWSKRLSQIDLAPRVGLSQSGLSSKIRGRRPFYPSELLRVSEQLGVDVAELFELCATRDSNPEPAD